MTCLHLTLDKHVWSALIPMLFYDLLFLVTLLIGIKKRVKFYSEGDSRYFFFISSDHNLNINRFSDDGIMIGLSYTRAGSILLQNIIKLPAMAFIPPKREKMSTKAFLSDLGRQYL